MPVKVIPLGIGAALVLAMTACGGSATPSAQQSSETPTASSSPTAVENLSPKHLYLQLLHHTVPRDLAHYLEGRDEEALKWGRIFCEDMENGATADEETIAVANSGVTQDAARVFAAEIHAAALTLCSE